MACSELMELNLNELEQAAGGDPLPRRRSSSYHSVEICRGTLTDNAAACINKKETPNDK